MKPAICLLSVIPMRKEASHRSEMVSQILFGEYVSIEEEKEDFVFVRCQYDGYEGWVQANQLTPVDPDEVFQTDHFTNGYSSLVTYNQTSVHIPYTTPVYNLEKLSFNMAGNTINYLLSPPQVWNRNDLKFSDITLEAVYQPFLNTPYLWGGKSVFGIDCSGFAQQVFKMFGVKLLRDAYLQAEQGAPIQSLEESQPGDLAFFQNENGRITHVGIILKNKQIVHAAGKVRIDPLDSEGIIHSENGKRTHRLHSIRRFFSPHLLKQ